MGSEKQYTKLKNVISRFSCMTSYRGETRSILKKKIFWRRKCVKRRVEGHFFFATRPLGHCATCNGSSYTKNEYNLFYQKLDAEYCFILQFFRKKSSIFRENSENIFGGALLTIVQGKEASCPQN